MVNFVDRSVDFWQDFLSVFCCFDGMFLDLDFVFLG